MRALWERHRSSVLVVAALLAAVLVAALWQASGLRSGVPLDPDNPGPEGARAVARVLDDQGVEVTVVRGADDLESEPVGGGTTVLVTSPEQLGTSTVDRLRRHAVSGEVVVAGADAVVVEQFDVSATPTPVVLTQPVSAQCDDPRFTGLEAYADSALAIPATGCFPTADGALLTSPHTGLTFLGAADLLSNEQVTLADNAAVALRLLGQGDRLVWYVPDAADLGAGETLSLGSLLPRWLGPALWLVLAVTVSLVLWRVRRLGPLASEPLPVVVKAIETTTSRGRLYRRAGDRGHAADALRAATRQRAAALLRLPVGDPAALAREVARHTGRPTTDVERLLGPGNPPPPSTDDQLVHLAGELATLEEEVRRT